jgi:hypothetical protein
MANRGVRTAVSAGLGKSGVDASSVAKYLDWYAADLAWREDHRRKDNQAMLDAVLRKALGHPTSRWPCGYWQGNHPPMTAFLTKAEAA